MVLRKDQFDQAYGNKRPLSGIANPTKRWRGEQGVKAGKKPIIVDKLSV